VTRRDDVRSVIERTVERFGRLDLMVANAGVAGPPAVAGFLEMTDEHWDSVLETNLTGTFFCGQEAARAMIATGGGGTIVNISSIGAFGAEELASAYCATKAAVDSLTRSMAVELAPFRITVNSVAPGEIRHGAAAAGSGEPGGTSGEALSDRQLIRRPGTPEDVGAAVVYLASAGARFVTGTTLVVDGGTLASSWLRPRDG
jgi:NAD(P)-dependent dehydrogenase (short-subunit alcohol dehydrogenase family)